MTQERRIRLSSLSELKGHYVGINALAFTQSPAKLKSSYPIVHTNASNSHQSGYSYQATLGMK